MKLEYSRKAVQYYRWIPDGRGDGSAEVDNGALVHAVVLNHPHSWERFHTKPFRVMASAQYLRRDEAVTAVCGRDVRVVYPMAFDTSEDEVCSECKGLLNARALLGEDAFARQMKTLEHRRWLEESERKRRAERRAQAQRAAKDLQLQPKVTADRSAEFDEIDHPAADGIPEGVDLRDTSTWVFPALREDQSGDDRGLA